MTRGSLVHKDGAYYIVYKETETTGYEGCTTTVKVAEDARKVSMLRLRQAVEPAHHREGHAASLPLRDRLRRDQVWAWPPTSLSSGSSEDGGRLKFSYTLDSGAENFISRNLVDITVDKLPEA